MVQVHSERFCCPPMRQHSCWPRAPGQESPLLQLELLPLLSYTFRERSIEVSVSLVACTVYICMSDSVFDDIPLFTLILFTHRLLADTPCTRVLQCLDHTEQAWGMDNWAFGLLVEIRRRCRVPSGLLPATPPLLLSCDYSCAFLFRNAVQSRVGPKPRVEYIYFYIYL